MRVDKVEGNITLTCDKKSDNLILRLILLAAAGEAANTLSKLEHIVTTDRDIEDFLFGSELSMLAILEECIKLDKALHVLMEERAVE